MLQALSLLIVLGLVLASLAGGIQLLMWALGTLVISGVRLLALIPKRRIRRDVTRLAAPGEDADASAPLVETIDLGAPAPVKPLHRRLALRDRRLLPKPQEARVGWDGRRRKIMGRDEATRLFAGTLRTRDRSLRDLIWDPAQLRRYGLPLWETEADLAKALNLSVPRLRHFSIHRQKERMTHYVQFAIPKRHGGERVILAPKRELKALQRELLTQLVGRLPVSEHAHGFVRQRSTATHARAHAARRVVIRLDIQDFFPSLHVGRVRGLLIALGYSYPVAATLATLMTEAPRQPVQVGKEIYHVPIGSRHTVQGAPTSPGIANAITLSLDRRLAGLASKLGFTYTRYADDLTFSGDAIELARRLIKSAQRIVHAEGFVLNAQKTRVMTRRGAQRITGVTVNREPGLSRRERRRLRAALHQARQGSCAASSRRQLEGKLAFLSMLNTRQAEALRPGLGA
jgi:hypothetical protein